MIAALTFLGAFFNRVRGGWLDTGYGGAINVAVFTALSGCFFFPQWWVGLGAGVAMYAGSAPGWGMYFGAMLGLDAAKGKALKEWTPVDFLISWAKPWPVLWGTLGTILRGGFWGACLYLITAAALWHWPWPFPWVVIGSFVSLPMACVIGHYLAVWQASDNPDGSGWEIEEVLQGAILWGLYFLTFAH